jgi:two-component system, NarL family, invasion response regulator UvrY
MLPIKIMVVEDHRLVRETWTKMLDAQPEFRVVAATRSGKGAIPLARKLKPDIVLMDISMSPMTCVDITSKMIRVCPGINVIGLSMHPQPSYAHKMMRAGARGYASKNPSREEITDAIMQVYCGAVYVGADIHDSRPIPKRGAKRKRSIEMLSLRETEIACLVRDGCSSKAIGVKLDLASRTVEVHRHNILRKLDLKNTAALVQFLTADNTITRPNRRASRI